MGLNQMVGPQVRRRWKTRLDVEEAVSAGGDLSTGAAVQQKPGRGIEVDTVLLEVLEDQPEGLHASHRRGRVEAGVPVEGDDAVLTDGWAGAGDQRHRLRMRNGRRRDFSLWHLRQSANARHQAETAKDGLRAGRG